MDECCVIQLFVISIKSGYVSCEYSDNCYHRAVSIHYEIHHNQDISLRELIIPPNNVGLQILYKSAISGEGFLFLIFYLHALSSSPAVKQIMGNKHLQSV